MKKIQNETPVLTKEDLMHLIDINTEIVVVAPWNGTPIPVTIRILDSVSLTSCGDFNTVSGVVQEDSDADIDQEGILKVKNIHENMLKLALVHPTFKELEEHLIDKDFYKQARNEIERIEKLVETLTSEVDKEKHRTVLDRLDLSLSFLLPEDFTTYIVTILMQREATDINKLTRNTLLQAGFLGEKYNTRPSEYLEGTFTEKQRVDIDVTALTLVSDYREQDKLNKGGMKWIRGGKK